jgi:hypothetical protein
MPFNPDPAYLPQTCTHNLQQFMNMPGAKVSPNTLNTMKRLFGCYCSGPVELTQEECIDIAQYLVLIHHDIREHLHNNDPLDWLSRHLGITQLLSLDGGHYHIHKQQGSLTYLHKDVSALFNLSSQNLVARLTSLCNVVPGPTADLESLYDCFHSVCMPFIHEPEGLLDTINFFDQTFSHPAALQLHVYDFQLWGYFTGLLCDLMGTYLAQGVPEATFPGFDLEEARNSKILQIAHNVYVHSQQAPNHLLVSVQE